MAKDVGNIMIAETILLIGAILGWRFMDSWVFPITTVVIVCLMILTLYFFRDPDRVIPTGEGLVVSPADGRIVRVEESVSLPMYMVPAKMVAIFLSLGDVHINRVPISGRVVSLEYSPGCYRPAFTHRSSECNEQQLVGIKGAMGKVYIKQIAGMVARRIVCRLRVGDRIRRGERFGMIKFGSRIELFLPSSVMLKVSEGDRVRGGESIIGVNHDV